MHLDCVNLPRKTGPSVALSKYTLASALKKSCGPQKDGVSAVRPYRLLCFRAGDGTPSAPQSCRWLVMSEYRRDNQINHHQQCPAYDHRAMVMGTSRGRPPDAISIRIEICRLRLRAAPDHFAWLASASMKISRRRVLSVPTSRSFTRTIDESRRLNNSSDSARYHHQRTSADRTAEASHRQPSSLDHQYAAIISTDVSAVARIVRVPSPSVARQAHRFS